ncbi:substrate-binding periplasmic protein [Alteromonas sp. CYL-A6]|uniref:substrate-binding periplasmic protein n=1 Tax=Alteromonas nitratireducens TaxID=3390813 RepID=UPI0034BEF67E
MACRIQADTFVVGAQDIQYYPHYDFGSEIDKGYAWAVLQAFAKATGHEFVYLDMPVRRLQMEMVKGKVDFVYPDNPDWYNQIIPASKKTFSQPLTRALGGTVMLADNVGQGIDAIKRLAMPLGFTPLNWQQRIDTKQTILTTVTDIPSGLKLLSRHRVDAMNIEYHVAKYIESVTPDISNLTLDVSLPHADVGFMVATIRHGKLIEQLDAFIDSQPALIARLKARYGLRDPQTILAELAEEQTASAH